jgi:hypothetical protein
LASVHQPAGFGVGCQGANGEAFSRVDNPA